MNDDITETSACDASIDSEKKDAELTSKEAADRLEVTPRRILNLIKSGRLPARREETSRGPIWKIRPDDLELVRQRKPGRPWPEKDGEETPKS